MPTDVVLERLEFPPLLPSCEHALYEHQFGDSSVALDSYNECSVRIDPQHPFHRSGDMYSNMGAIYESRGDQGAALAHLQLALGVAPFHQLAHFNVANSLRSLGRNEEAVVSFRRSLSAVPDPRFRGPSAAEQLDTRWKTLSSLGDTLLRSPGHSDEALEAYAEATSIAPAEAWSAWFNYGVLRYKQQHSRGVNAAAHAFTATLAIAPGCSASARLSTAELSSKRASFS